MLFQCYRLLPESDTFELAVTELDDSTKLPRLRLKGPLDRETLASYTLTLQAIDGGQPPLDGTLQLIIHITDSNDNPPAFDVHAAGGEGTYHVQVLGPSRIYI